MLAKSGSSPVVRLAREDLRLPKEREQLLSGGLGALGPAVIFLSARVKPAILKLREVLGWSADLGILSGDLREDGRAAARGQAAAPAAPSGIGEALAGSLSTDCFSKERSVLRESPRAATRSPRGAGSPPSGLLSTPPSSCYCCIFKVPPPPIQLPVSLNLAVATFSLLPPPPALCDLRVVSSLTRGSYANEMRGSCSSSESGLSNGLVLDTPPTGSTGLWGF